MVGRGSGEWDGGGARGSEFFYYESKLKYFLGRGGGARVSDFFY